MKNHYCRFIDRVLETESISKDYHNVTKINDLLVDEGGMIVKLPELWTKVAYKAYPRFERFFLPVPKKINVPFEQVLHRRKSRRDFNPKSYLSMQELSTVLKYSGGVRRDGVPDIGNRYYPSAGARYPNEIYPVVFRVNGLDKGVYHYYLRNHELESLWTYPNFIKKIDKQFNQKWIKNAGALLVVSAVFERNQVKYRERGYRHVLVDTGHLCQNIYLVCAALGLKCCSIGGFVDNGLNGLLGLDGLFESVVIVVAIGN